MRLIPFLFLASCISVGPNTVPDKILTVQERAASIRSLQEGHTSTEDEAEILRLFRGVTGAELLELKREIDEQWTHRNLYHLVYSDIDDDAIRSNLLVHLKQNARAERSLKVLSDIDDTIVASWIDARYPSGTVYPCVLNLYKILGTDSAPTFISARPGDRFGVVEQLTIDSLRANGLPQATILAGDVLHLTSHGAMADMKYSNYVQYAELYPEYDFVFAGDSGQGDALLGEKLLTKHGNRVKAVFIHDVENPEEGQERTPMNKRVESAKKGLYYVDTWLDAALAAHQLKLIDDPSLSLLADRCSSDLDAIAFTSETLRSAQQEHMDRALETARTLSGPTPDKPEPSKASTAEE